MGRIKTKQVKRLTKELMKQSDDFTTDFEENKKVISEISSTNSKKIRNVIAGYATRLVKEQQKRAI